jgi:hypothetical protein
VLKVALKKTNSRKIKKTGNSHKSAVRKTKG